MHSAPRYLVVAVTFALGLGPVGAATAHHVVDVAQPPEAVLAPLPSDAAARIGTTLITRADYEHWFVIAVATGGEMDKPPDVRERIALREQVMQFLTLELWVRLEAPEHGVKVTDAEAERAHQKARRETFPRDRDWRTFLEQSKMTEADARFQTRFDTLFTKLRRHAMRPAKTAEGRVRLSDRFDRHLRRKWRARTACGKRYKSRLCAHVVAIQPVAAPPPEAAVPQ